MGESETPQTALAIRPPALSGYIPPPAKDEFEAMISMANTLAKAQGFLPAHFFGQPYKILAAILYGRDLGISATNALQHIIVIEGKATADAQLIGMLVRRAGHRLEDKTTDQASTVTITRDDGSVHTVTFTMADAQRAGLVRAGGAWTKYPAAMLYARALTACARKGAQDALMGTIYTPEELGVEVEDGQPATAAPVVEVAEFREIPTTEATPESVDALKAAETGVPQSSSSGSAPNTEAASVPVAQSGVGAAQTPPQRSTGPRAKRGHVVTAPEAVKPPATAPVAAPAPLNEPVGPTPLDIAGMREKVEGMKAKAAARAAKPDPGKAEYLATLRQSTRETAALLRQLRVRMLNAEGGEPVALPEATPGTESDESLAVFIANQYPGKVLATLDEKELEAVSKTLDDLIVRVEAKLK